jgi:hypothetical protein
LVKNYQKYSVKHHEPGSENTLPNKIRNAKKKHTKCGHQPIGYTDRRCMISNETKARVYKDHFEGMSHTELSKK